MFKTTVKLEETYRLLLQSYLDDIEEAREINHEAYLDDADQYRLGKSDAYLEVLSILRKAFNLM